MTLMFWAAMGRGANGRAVIGVAAVVKSGHNDVTLVTRDNKRDGRGKGDGKEVNIIRSLA
jgi:hypothetical protein